MYGFTLNGTINSWNDFGLHFTKILVIPDTQRVIDINEIDVRGGSLTMFKGWENLSFSFKVAISDKAQWVNVLPQIVNAEMITQSNEICGQCTYQ
ncbi:hypothetical protein [Neobacillus sp. CF12]|uniref:hypothetical protein n=1 Tax=Neobacillus sp. CF12 TaxID=3055864 RepID=UPI0025A0C385|nr:hypothetical protein [Neobacillus sp. CF12]MDM5326822.1 hypothetical protein [Neobacillus sp. CF12]